MNRIFIALCDNINLSTEDFINYFSEIVHNDNVDTGVLVGDKSILELITKIRKQYYSKYGEEIKLNVLILQDLNDTDYIFERFKFKIKEFPDSEILLNITHGSSKVSAIAMIISKLYGLKIQDRLKIEDPSKLKNFDVIEQSTNSNKPMYYIKRLFNNYNFKLANEILEDNYNTKSTTERMFSVIINIYRKWDQFEYEDFDFNKIESYFLNLHELPLNNNAVQIILDKNHEKHNVYKIADMLNNATRRIEEERYDDAIIRLYKALELIGEVQLQEKYGMRKTDIRLEDIDNLNIDNRAKNNIRNRLDFKYPRYQIPLTTTFFILQKLHDEVGIYYSKNKQKYQELFQKRNVSVLIHGDYKYSVSEINEMLKRVTDLALIYDKSIKKAMNELTFPKFNI